MAGGHADDLASCVLMATDKPVLVAPAMNPRMWLHPATRRNVALLQADGIHFIGPNIGEMAERGEAGPGRMSEVPELVEAISGCCFRPLPAARLPRGTEEYPIRLPLAGRHVLVTSGPTHEPIDPVRTSPTVLPASRARPSPPRPGAGRARNSRDRADHRASAHRRDGRER